MDALGMKMNKPAAVLRLIVILLAVTVIYHSLDMSFECQLAHSCCMGATKQV